MQLLLQVYTKVQDKIIYLKDEVNQALLLTDNLVLIK